MEIKKAAQNRGNMEVHKLSEKELMEIYNGRAAYHFPEEERKPSSTIQRLWQEGVYEGLGLYEEKGLAAYALFVKPKGKAVALLDYYAVMEECRSAGIGSFFLEQMKNYYAELDGLLIETEALEASKSEDELVLRRRRNAFYEKNGAVDSGIRSCILGVRYWIWYLPIRKNKGSKGRKTIREEMEAIYHLLLTGEREDAMQFWYQEGL